MPKLIFIKYQKLYKEFIKVYQNISIFTSISFQAKLNQQELTDELNSLRIEVSQSSNNDSLALWESKIKEIISWYVLN